MALNPHSEQPDLSLPEDYKHDHPDEHLHVFVDEGEVRAAVAEDPAAFEPLLWGQRLRGLRIRIAVAPAHRIAELLEESWRRKAPARLATEWDARRGTAG